MLSYLNEYRYEWNGILYTFETYFCFGKIILLSISHFDIRTDICDHIISCFVDFFTDFVAHFIGWGDDCGRDQL